MENNEDYKDVVNSGWFTPDYSTMSITYLIPIAILTTVLNGLIDELFDGKEWDQLYTPTGLSTGWSDNLTYRELKGLTNRDLVNEYDGSYDQEQLAQILKELSIYHYDMRPDYIVVYDSFLFSHMLNDSTVVNFDAGNNHWVITINDYVTRPIYEARLLMGHRIREKTKYQDDRDGDNYGSE